VTDMRKGFNGLLSIGMEPGPPIGVQKGPLCGVGLGARG